MPPSPPAPAQTLHLASNPFPLPTSPRSPRVAYFPDSFHEVNGVAHTSRNFAAYAERRGLPFLCVRASLDGQGPRRQLSHTGPSRALELRRSPLAIQMEKDLQFDPLFLRHGEEISAQLRAFRPDIIHITGPSELGIFGAWFAWKHGIPLAASWHTNLHEYAGRRLAWLSRILPGTARARLEHAVETASLAATLRFYKFAKVLFAPNPELCTLLERSTGKPCHLMQRGVDTALFTPSRRPPTPGSLVACHSERSEDPPYLAPRSGFGSSLLPATQAGATPPTFTLGYVGRLSIEKNVAQLIRIERELHALGLANFRFLVVGQGNEDALLRRELRRAVFPGVLRGEALARAYASMDLLVFPSHTDTFGNVVLEALASGVPAVVTPSGGPRFIVRDGYTGFIVPDAGFAPAIASLLRDPSRHAAMRHAARAHALTCSWDTVFDRVYAAYPSPAPQA